MPAGSGYRLGGQRSGEQGYNRAIFRQGHSLENPAGKTLSTLSGDGLREGDRTQGSSGGSGAQSRTPSDRTTPRREQENEPELDDDNAVPTNCLRRRRELPSSLSASRTECSSLRDF